VSSTVYYVVLRRENARRDRGERDELIEGDSVKSDDRDNGSGGAAANGRFTSVEEAKREKGDEWSGYRYTL
jgi:hypothetical protein